MILIVGGAYQGKTAFARTLAGERTERVMENVHEWIRRKLKEGFSRQQIGAFLEEKFLREPDMIFVADEIGYGIVPMDAFDREYRECAGRLLCGLAKRADEVYRVVAGLPVKIKG